MVGQAQPGTRFAVRNGPELVQAGSAQFSGVTIVVSAPFKSRYWSEQMAHSFTCGLIISNGWVGSSPLSLSLFLLQQLVRPLFLLVYLGGLPTHM